MTSGNIEKAEKIANAVLYEGYMLYPYRASSTKNRWRPTFGTLYPEKHQDVMRGLEPCRNQTQCLLNGTASSTISVRVRFLQMRSRVIEAHVPDAKERFRPVDALAVGTEIHQTWEEAGEGAMDASLRLGEIVDCARIVPFAAAPFSESIELRNPAGELAGRVRRRALAISGKVRISAEPLQCAGWFRLTVEVLNASPWTPEGDRLTALLSSLVSAHTILGVRDGEFMSLLAPLEDLRGDAAACKNIGLYPVLAGVAGEHDVMLASPIVLYDYPQIAPESARDFFDSTEIDELLTLRVMTLTDGEKSEMRGSDAHVRELLENTEANAREQLARTHGTMRNLRRAEDDAA